MIMKRVLASIIGGLLGYLYYKKIGCSTGTCPITSNPFASVVYGIIIMNLFTF